MKLLEFIQEKRQIIITSNIKIDTVS